MRNQLPSPLSPSLNLSLLHSWFICLFFHDERGLCLVCSSSFLLLLLPHAFTLLQCEPNPPTALLEEKSALTLAPLWAAEGIPSPAWCLPSTVGELLLWHLEHLLPLLLLDLAACAAVSHWFFSYISARVVFLPFLRYISTEAAPVCLLDSAAPLSCGNQYILLHVALFFFVCVYFERKRC